MTSVNAKLVTIYTESALESQLLKDIEELGATGYTTTNARGKGSSGARDASWEANANIRVEIICSAEVAKDIIEHLQTSYYDNFAMVLFHTDIEVLRPEKFSS